MSKYVSVTCVAVLCALLAATSAEEARWALLAPAAFDLESTLQLNDAARADREVGYKLRARLSVVPRWAAPDHSDYLLQFHLKSPKLYLRGKHMNADFMPYESVWDSHSDSTFYAHWAGGEIKAAYLDPDELPDILNYKKALLSLFQIQMLDGEYNETDVSGSCRVLYETISKEVFRKIKRSCAGDDVGGVSSARRVTRYTRGAGGGLAALHAEELLALGPAALGLKARGWHSLAARAPPPSSPLAASLPAALRALPRGLSQQALRLQTRDEDEELPELSAALAQAKEALAGEGGAGEGGGAAGAAAALQLLPALRRANHSVALQLLQRPDMHDQLAGLCRMLGLAGTRAAHRAADDFLQLSAQDPLADLAHTYLAGFALAPQPDEAAVLDVLRLGEAARTVGVRQAALLAAAAAARSCPAAAAAVRDSLLRGLARCRDVPCAALRLRALSNLPGADPDLLLTHARGPPAPALAALSALDAAPAALSRERLSLLQALALNESAALEVRAAALEQLVRRRAAWPDPLASALFELHARREHELRRILWQSMEAHGERAPLLRQLPARLGPVLRGWDCRAPGGSSSLLSRSPGWSLAGWQAELQSLQVARAGLLRRGEVRLQARDDSGNTFDALAVEVWTRGLEAFGGGSGDASAEPAQPVEEPGGGLGLTVAGARLPDISLFEGQAELLGHVWAGTASAATPVLRALRPLQLQTAHVPLLAGVLLRADVRAALALALDAQAQVSLWWRSARAELQLRAGLAAQAEMRVRTAWSELTALADVRVEPRLRIAADLDFYSTVALCVRVSTEPHSVVRSVELRSRGGARRLRVRRERVSRTAVPGRTLALGRPNDVTCRTLRAADAEAEADADAGSQ